MLLFFLPVDIHPAHVILCPRRFFVLCSFCLDMKSSLLRKDVGRHVKQGKTCSVKGVRLKYSTLKPSSLVSVTACRGRAAVCLGLKVLSPDIFASTYPAQRYTQCPSWFLILETGHRLLVTQRKPQPVYPTHACIIPHAHGMPRKRFSLSVWSQATRKRILKPQCIICGLLEQYCYALSDGKHNNNV